MAAELGVDINMASTPGKPELRPKTFHEDNLFTKVGFDGLGGTARIRKPLRELYLIKMHYAIFKLY